MIKANWKLEICLLNFSSTDEAPLATGKQAPKKEESSCSALAGHPALSYHWGSSAWWRLLPSLCNTLQSVQVTKLHVQFVGRRVLTSMIDPALGMFQNLIFWLWLAGRFKFLAVKRPSAHILGLPVGLCGGNEMETYFTFSNGAGSTSNPGRSRPLDGDRQQI